jgi:hypothetical protein
MDGWLQTGRGISSNGRAIAIKDQHIGGCKRSDAARMSITVQEFDLEAVWRQQLDNGADVADRDVGVSCMIQNGHDVQQAGLAGSAHF